MISKDDKIYISGHNGMVGSACWRILTKNGYRNLVGKSSKELDLRNQNQVNNFFEREKPVAVIDAAARVGGIYANDSFPYEFLLDNMQIQNNLIMHAHTHNVQKFIFLGSSCIYPKYSKQPIKEEYLLSDKLESTNQWYALAKITGIKLIEALRKQYKRDYISLMPTNLFGPGDNYHPKNSHVIPALISRFHNAKVSNLKEVKIWGSGKPLREFMFVDDLAEICSFFLEKNLDEYFSNVGIANSHINVGTGFELSIYDLSKTISKIIGFKGKITFDESMPDGTPRKLLDSSRLKSFGWNPKYDFEKSLLETYQDYKKLL